ncbi:MAG: DNA gyrase subunit A, partial [Firmicutes bacterium HGW-Firmicutes-19]
TVVDLMEVIKGPDFPTGAYILGRSGIKQAYETGRGSIIVRAKVDTLEMANGKKQLIVSEIPYQVNKANLVEKIAQLVRDKLIEGITDLRDESNRDGIRVVIELRRDVQSEVILNQLYRMTALQTTFGVNMLALVDNAPKQLSIKEVLNHYIDHQVDVVVRRTNYDLNRAKDRAHILEGLRIALDFIDEVIAIIRSSKDDTSAMVSLIERFGLSEIQAKAILDMRLRRLTGLERSKIEEEYAQLMSAIADFEDILANHWRIMAIIKDELLEVKARFKDLRRTEVIEADLDMQDEDLIPVEDVVIAMTLNGYIKRTTIDTFHVQNRGGKGVKGMATHSDDIVDQFITMSTHDYLLLFTNFGKVYRIKGYRVPQASRIAKGIPVVNLLNLDKDEKVKAMSAVSTDSNNAFFVFSTKEGLVKRVAVSEFESIRQSGKIAISLRDGDELIAVKQTTGDDEVIIAGANGKAVRFNENDVRPMGRNAAGVRGFNVDGSEVIGMTTDKEGEYILAVTQGGYGKKSSLEDYRLTNRGAKGVKTINITEKNGPLVSMRAVTGKEELLIVTDEGIVIRISLKNVGTYGRNTQGVKLIQLGEGHSVSSVAVIPVEEVEETAEKEEINA